MQNDEFQAALDAVIRDKTFTLEAVEGIKELRGRLSLSESVNQELKIKNNELETNKLNDQKIINLQSEEIEKWKGRESSLQEREAKISNLETKQALSEMEAKLRQSFHSDLKEVLLSISRSPVFRKTTNDTVVTTVPGQGYPNTTPVYKTETSEIE